nr:putative quinol monooxygenase [Henriciella sp.]
MAAETGELSEIGMIVIEGTVRINPDRLEAARPAMQKVVLASRAEPGCIDYAYAADLIEPDLIRVSERWQDRDSLKAHFQTLHMAEWRSTWPSLNIHARSLRLYEADPEDI